MRNQPCRAPGKRIDATPYPPTHRAPNPFVTEPSRESTMQNLNSPDPNSNLRRWVCGQPGRPPVEGGLFRRLMARFSPSFHINKVIVLACRAAALDVCPIREVRRLALNVAPAGL
jgi:hypothetical protein